MVKIFNKKAAGISSETLAKILLLLGFLIVAGLIIGVITGFFSLKNADRTVCLVSNALISSNAFFKTIFPTGCSVELIDEPVDEEVLSELLKDTWWMFGKGDYDLGNFGHETFTPFAFKPKTNIQIPQFFYYLQTHRGDKAVTDRAKSDYQYLQKGSFGQSLCTANNMIEEGKMLSLEEGQLYYINFFDDQKPHDCGDKIIISKEPGFTYEYFEDPNYFVCYSPDTQRLLVVGAVPPEQGPGILNLMSPALGLASALSQDEATFCEEETSGER